MESSYPEFRRRLDALLRRRDPQALREFLIAEGQWQSDATTDPERAMWMMIATSPPLGEHHEEAVRWLADHGYAEEARVLGGGARGDPAPRRPAQVRRGSPAPRSRHGAHRPQGKPERQGPGASRRDGRPGSSPPHGGG